MNEYISINKVSTSSSTINLFTNVNTFEHFVQIQITKDISWDSSVVEIVGSPTERTWVIPQNH